MKRAPRLSQRLLSSSGQSLVELALVMPLSCVLVLGIVETGYALLDQHKVTSLSREGSNLISRETTLQDAATALSTMSTSPVNFSSGSKVIFSVLKKVGTIGAANYNRVVVYQRHVYGDLSVAGTSALATPGGSFGPAPEFQAVNSDNDTNLRVTTLPANLTMITGGLMYVTEVYTTHTLLTPVDRFGLTIPSGLYSIAYF